MSIANIEVFILATSMRDGAQSLPADHQFDTGSKPVIAERIANMGVNVIEAGFPATPSDAEEVAEVARTVGRKVYGVNKWDNQGRNSKLQLTPVIAGLARATEADIEATWGAICMADRPRVHTFVATDEGHVRAKFPGMTQLQVQEMGIRAVRFAKELSSEHQGATVEFSAEAASTTSPKYLERIVRHAVEAGVDVINVPDTVGQCDAATIFSLYSHVMRWALEVNPFVTVSAHNHNDLGQAVANTNMLVHAAMQYAQEKDMPVNVQLETTICGLGERAGNADVFPVAAGLFKIPPEASVAPVTWYFNPARAVETARMVMGAAGFEVPRQSPIVGSDINVHRSGVHSAGIISGGHGLYTPFDPTFGDIKAKPYMKTESIKAKLEGKLR